MATMAKTWASRLVSANTRDGVDTRKKVNCDGMRTRVGDNLYVEAITCLGNPAVNNWGDMMTGMFATRSVGVPVPYNPVRLYADMADEPWKYGDDILEWEDMDNQLRAGPENDQVVSYWQDRAAREQVARFERDFEQAAAQKMWRSRFTPIAKQVAKVCAKRWVQRDINRHVARIRNAAVTIQAAVRGYQARCKDARQDCCMCLAHRISPLKTSVGYMCRDCAELGPYEDLVEKDPWNWHRADYVCPCRY
jgi:hypothetical protein